VSARAAGNGAGGHDITAKERRRPAPISPAKARQSSIENRKVSLSLVHLNFISGAFSDIFAGVARSPRTRARMSVIRQEGSPRDHRDSQ
jgi:hypothetical protein